MIGTPQQKSLTSLRSTTGSLVVALVLAAAQTSCAQQQVTRLRAQPVGMIAHSANPPSVTPAQVPVRRSGNVTMASGAAFQEVAETGEPDAAHNPGGITIHGHWVLELKDKDGNVTDRREFENSLVTDLVSEAANGAQLVAAMMAGAATAGDPALGLLTTGATEQDCVGLYNAYINGKPPTSAPNCFALTTTNSLWNKNSSSGYIATGLSSTATFSPNVQLQLNGVYTFPTTIPVGLQIVGVQSLWGTCFSSASGLPQPSPGQTRSVAGSGEFRSADLSALNCTLGKIGPDGGEGTAEASIIGPLTAVTLGSPMNVSPGQVVAVSVTLTFS